MHDALVKAGARSFEQFVYLGKWKGTVPAGIKHSFISGYRGAGIVSSSTLVLWIVSHNRLSFCHLLCRFCFTPVQLQGRNELCRRCGRKTKAGPWQDWPQHFLGLLCLGLGFPSRETPFNLLFYSWIPLYFISLIFPLCFPSCGSIWIETVS